MRCHITIMAPCTRLPCTLLCTMYLVYFIKSLQQNMWSPPHPPHFTCWSGEVTCLITPLENDKSNLEPRSSSPGPGGPPRSPAVSELRHIHISPTWCVVMAALESTGGIVTHFHKVGYSTSIFCFNLSHARISIY